MIPLPCILNAGDDFQVGRVPGCRQMGRRNRLIGDAEIVSIYILIHVIRTEVVLHACDDANVLLACVDNTWVHT